MLAKRWMVVFVTGILLQPLLGAAASATVPPSQAPVSCLQYGVNKAYGGGWGTMALVRRGERVGKDGQYALYEVLIRINYANRMLVDRTGLVVASPGWAQVQ